MTTCRRTIKSRVCFLLALALIWALLAPIAGGTEETRLRPETWGRKVLSEHLDNWYQVDPLLFRSEQPDQDGMREIAAFGIKRVLNLRWLHDDEDEAEGTGLKLYHVPMLAEAVNEDLIVEALRIIGASSDPILVHCQHGSDRTGIVSAMYRIIYQGWSKTEAINEMRQGGYGFHAIFNNLPRFIENADIKAIRKKLAEDGKELGLKPFTSDGCSAFPDGTLAQPEKWRHCCLNHDLAYWKGGTYEERLAADQALRACVTEIGEPKLAELMLQGIRLGGSPYLPTNFRWGYGWSEFRGYQPLTENEKTSIKRFAPENPAEKTGYLK